MAELGARLTRIKEQEGLVNIEERRTLLDQGLKELGSALNERKTERLQKEALWRQMAATANSEELPEVMRSGLVQSLRIEIASLERQQALLQERYLDQHPEVIKVRNQLKETRRKLRGEAQHVIRASENDYKASAAQEASVAAALESSKQEALELSKRALNYDTQKRELDAAQLVLNSVMAREKETDVATQLKASNIRVVDPAVVPKAPIRPLKSRDIGMGVLLGAFLCIGLVFFLEYLDNTLKTPDDVRHHLGGVPLLGVVPQLAEVRLPWLFTNLVGSLISGAILWYFRMTLQEVVAIVSFIPVIAAMGGNVGLHSSTLIIRGLATGVVELSDVRTVFFREVKVGLLMGLACGVMLTLVGWAWHQAFLGMVVGTSLVIAFLVSTSMATIMPVVLKRMGVDPAVAAGPFVTTAYDITGITIYLSLATLFLDHLR